MLGSPSLDFMYISASAPDAPPLSDTTIGCFIRLFFWIAACIMRAIWSEAPPAPAATTISTGLVGSQAANAGALANMAVKRGRGFHDMSHVFLPYLFVWLGKIEPDCGSHCADYWPRVQDARSRSAYDFRMRLQGIAGHAARARTR